MQISTFNDEQLAGQRLMLGFDGTGLNADLKFLIGDIKAGGIILFARNIETPDQVKDLCFSVQEFAGSCGQPFLDRSLSAADATLFHAIFYQKL